MWPAGGAAPGQQPPPNSYGGYAQQAPPPQQLQAAGGSLTVHSRHLWVGNLTQKISQAELSAHFSRFGPLDSVVTYPGRHFAFVNFKTTPCAVEALRALAGTPIGGPHLRVEFARGGTPSLQLCLTHLSRDFSLHDWAATFARFGRPASLQFNERLASALVRYASLEEAVAAHNGLQGQLVGGETLEVSFEAEPAAAPPLPPPAAAAAAAPPPPQPRHRFVGPGGLSGQGAPPAAQPARGRGRSRSRSRSPGRRGGGGRSSPARRRARSGWDDPGQAPLPPPPPPPPPPFQHQSAPPMHPSHAASLFLEGATAAAGGGWEGHPPPPYALGGGAPGGYPPPMQAPQPWAPPVGAAAPGFPPPPFQPPPPPPGPHFMAPAASAPPWADPPLPAYAPPPAAAAPPWAEAAPPPAYAPPPAAAAAAAPPPPPGPTWRGRILKSGAPVCAVACVRGAPGAPLPVDLNCSARTGLELLAAHLKSVPFSVIELAPAAGEDVAPLGVFLAYLRERERAGVAKSGDTTIFLVPPSAWAGQLLRCEPTANLLGVVTTGSRPVAAAAAAAPPPPPLALPPGLAALFGMTSVGAP